MKKVKVNIAWNREASTIAEDKGFKALVKSKKVDLVFETKEFASREIALAYLEGVADANGWDEPYTEIEDSEEPKSTYIVTSTHGENLSDPNCNDNWTVFPGEEFADAYSEALDEYNGLLKVDGCLIAVLAKVIESTDY